MSTMQSTTSLSVPKVSPTNSIDYLPYNSKGLQRPVTEGGMNHVTAMMRSAFAPPIQSAISMQEVTVRPMEEELMIPLQTLCTYNGDSERKVKPYPRVIDVKDDQQQQATNTSCSSPSALLLGCLTNPPPPSVANGLRVAQAQAMAVAVATSIVPNDSRQLRLANTRLSPFHHRASFHGRGGSHIEESNGSLTAERLSHSLPGSPADRRPNFPQVIGSAESLVGRVLVEQGLGKFCDADFVRNTSREMQEAMDMTQEEMDRAAHRLVVQSLRQGRPLSFQGSLERAHL